VQEMSDPKKPKPKERRSSISEKKVSFDLPPEEPKRHRTPPAKLERQKVVPLPVFPGGKHSDFTLMDFPEKFLLHIFEYLTPFEWCKASEVCKRWKTLLYSDHLWHTAFMMRWPQEASNTKLERDKKETWRDRYRHYHRKEEKKNKEKHSLRSDNVRTESQMSHSRPALTVSPKDNAAESRTKLTRTASLRRKANSVTSSSYDFDAESVTTNSSVETDVDHESFDLNVPGSGYMQRAPNSADTVKKTKLTTAPLNTNDESRRSSLSASGSDDTLLRNVFKSVPEVSTVEESPLDDFLTAPLSRILSLPPSLRESTNRMTKIRNELLIWANQQLTPYKTFVTVQSLEHFFDGCAFLALIHKYDPNSINLKEFDTSDKRKTFQTALELAEKYMDIPNLLNIDSVISGKNNRSLLLYLCLFKFRFDELERKNNPLVAVRHEINGLKSLLSEQIGGLEITKKEFEEDCNRLSALTCNEALDEEHKYYEQRAQMMDKIVSSAKETIDILLAQNKKLTEQNIALQDKVRALEKMLQIEEERRRKAEEDLTLEEKIKALGQLLEEKDIAQYLKENAESLTKLMNDESARMYTENTSQNSNSNNDNNIVPTPKTLVFL
jgi:hypothetical protein